MDSLRRQRHKRPFQCTFVFLVSVERCQLRLRWRSLQVLRSHPRLANPASVQLGAIDPGEEAAIVQIVQLQVQVQVQVLLVDAFVQHRVVHWADPARSAM